MAHIHLNHHLYFGTNDALIEKQSFLDPHHHLIDIYLLISGRQCVPGTLRCLFYHKQAQQQWRRCKATREKSTPEATSHKVRKKMIMTTDVGAARQTGETFYATSGSLVSPKMPWMATVVRHSQRNGERNQVPGDTPAPNILGQIHV